MKSTKDIVYLVITWVLWTIVWFCVELQTLMWVSCHEFATAGELFALFSFNQYEASDTIMYGWRYVSPYMLIFAFLYVGGCVCIWRVAKKERRLKLVFVGVEILLLLPFILPISRACLLREAIYAVQQRRYIEERQNESTNFQYNASISSMTPSVDVMVLALGESLRYDNISLNGQYMRHTMPLLENVSNLWSYSDYYANSTLTQYAIPMLLTCSEPETFLDHFKQKTVGAAFKQVGYRTFLVTNHAQLMNNGIHNYLAKDMDSVIVVSSDSLICVQMNEIIRQYKKAFIITHYQGNHFLYTNNTKENIKWRPDYNADKNAKSDSLFVNAYDNSILYTDQLLFKAIHALDTIKAKSVLFFVSDHGETITSYVGMHGFSYHPTKDEYHVPLIVWYSDEYAAAYPDKVTNMISHKDESVCADHVFWSVLDMADIQIDSTLQQEGMSIFGDTLLPHKRTLLLPNGKSVMNLD